LTVSAPLHVVPYAGLIVLAGLLGLALFVAGVLLLRRPGRERAGRNVAVGAVVLLAMTLAASMVATWLAAAAPTT
jgi:hypothetical protein